MAIGDSAGILFRVKSTYDGTGVRQAKGDVTDLGAAGKLAGGGLASMINPATLAAAGVAAIGAASVAAVAGLFRLTEAAAEYGSKIFDAQQKTGLGAETLTALKYAAEQSGSSFEQVTKGVSVFGVTIGQAAQGSEKAQEKLKALGITSTDLNTALGQAFKTINAGKTDTEKLALAAEVFGKKIGPDLIPLIKDADGNLEKMTATAKALGVTLTNEDIRAAEQFGDTLGLLKMQAAGLGRQFATELMPMMTGAMSSISQFMVANQGTARFWGQELTSVAKGVGATFQGLGNLLDGVLTGMTLGLLDNAQKSRVWAAVVEMSINLVTAGLYGLAKRIGETFGSAAPDIAGQVQTIISGTPQGIDTGTIPTPPRPAAPRGGSQANDAERRRREADAEAEKRRREAEQLAARNLRAGIASAKNNLGLDTEDIAATLDEMTELLRIFGTSDKVVDKIAQGFKRLETNVNLSLDALEALENQERSRNTDAENALLTQEQRLRRDKEEAALEKAREEFKQRVADLDKERDDAAGKRLDREIEATKELMRLEKEREDRQLAAPPLERPVPVGPDGNPISDVVGDISFGDQAAMAGIETMTEAFQGLGQAIGQVVSAWVLYGNAGASVKKVTAQILASIAQQAAVKAIFELAEGFAALAKAFFGIPNAGPSAAAHFKAAAIYGTVAGIAAVAGRATAGGAFGQEANGATGGGGDSDQGNKPGLVFTEKFDGFTKQLAAMNDRQNLVTGHLADTVEKFNEKFGVTTPDAVVMAGAEGAAESIFNANQKVMQEDPWAPTQQRRNQGDYR